MLASGARRPRPPRQFSQAALDEALADPARKDQRDAADARRKPGPLIALAGVKPGDKVFDLIPGSGYWTRIFSEDRRARKARSMRSGRRPMRAKRWAMSRTCGSSRPTNITAISSPRFSRSTTLTAPEPLDVVWTSQNFHDYPDEFMGKGDPSSLNKAVFKILKPGGTFMIIDHMAKPGRGMADTEKLHRIDPATVRKHRRRRGLQVRGREQGARTIPPTRSTSRCSTSRSAATPASSPTSS